MFRTQKSFTFEIEIYGARVHIFYLLSEEQIKKYIGKNFPGAKYDRPNGFSAYSSIVECDHFSEYIIDFILPAPTKAYLQDTISHESLHISSYIFEDRGITFDKNNPEPFAYLLGFIVKKINEGIDNK